MESKGASNSGRSSSQCSWVCPTCQQRVTVTGQQNPGRHGFFPFCSERCKLIDLGAWLDAEYRIAGDRSDPADDAPEPPPAVPPEASWK